MPGVWAFVLGGVVIAPLLTWLPMLAQRYPRLWLPKYHPAWGIDAWSMQALWTVLLLLVAAFAWQQRDRWMALALGWITVPIFLWGGTMNPTHAALFAAGCLLVLLMRTMPAGLGATLGARDPGAPGSSPGAGVTLIRRVVIGCGLFQALYAIQQKIVNYDVLWGPLVGGELVPYSQPLGTLGTVDALGSFVAICAPLMSPWLLPIAALAVACTKSYTAIAAFLAGMLTLSVIRRARWTTAVWLLVALVIVASVFLAPWKSPDTFWGRLAIVEFGVRVMLQNAPVMGFGLGGWAQLIPQLQAHVKFLPNGELWREAHNEPAQWLVEAGLVGGLLLAGWLWRYRRMFRHPVWGGSLVALAVSSLGFFPFHVVPVALLGLLLVGLGTAEHSPLTMSEG